MVVVLYDATKETEIELMKELFHNCDLIYRPDLTALELMLQVGNRRFDTAATSRSEDIKIVFDSIFRFAEKEELEEKGYHTVRFPKEKQVFISYSVKDEKDVEQLVPKLNAFELPVWFAPYSIDASGSITESVQLGIETSNTVIFWVTKNFLESKWCKHEMRAFICKMVENDAKLFIVLDDNVKSEDLPLFLRDIKYIRHAGMSIQELSSYIAGEISKVLKRR